MAVGAVGPWETVLGFLSIDGTTSPNLGWYSLGTAIIAALAAVSYLVNASRVNFVFLVLAGAVGTMLSLYDEWSYGSTYGTGWGLGVELGASLVLLVLSIGFWLPARSGTSLRSGSGRSSSRQRFVVFLVVFFFLFGSLLLHWPWNDVAWIAFGLVTGLAWLRPRTKRELANAAAIWDRKHPDLAAERTKFDRPPLSFRRFVRRLEHEPDISRDELRYAIDFVDAISVNNQVRAGRFRRVLVWLGVMTSLAVVSYVIGLPGAAYALGLMAVGRWLQVAHIRWIVPRRMARARQVATARLAAGGG